MGDVKYADVGTFLVVQWLRFCAPNVGRGARVRSLVRELDHAHCTKTPPAVTRDFTCHSLKIPHATTGKKIALKSPQAATTTQRSQEKQ